MASFGVLTISVSDLDLENDYYFLGLPPKAVLKEEGLKVQFDCSTIMTDCQPSGKVGIGSVALDSQ